MLSISYCKISLVSANKTCKNSHTLKKLNNDH